MQLRQQVAVGDDEAARDPQPHALGLLEERLLGCGKVRAEHQRRRGPVGREAVHEPARDLARVAGVGEPGLLGKRAGPQPVEQLEAHRADDRHLRVVDMRVDEAGQQDGVALVDHVGVRVSRAHARVVAAVEDAPVGERDRAVRE